MKILFRILLNEAKDPEGRHIAPCDGYKPEHPLVQAYSSFLLLTDKYTDELILDSLWETFNIDHPESYKNRSLCVGDVIVIERWHTDCVAYAVDRFGFKRVECPAGMTSLTAVQ